LNGRNKPDAADDYAEESLAEDD
ncbi:DUF413 domain-containing protein, partial [Vibrio parahaemolyticus]